MAVRLFHLIRSSAEGNSFLTRLGASVTKQSRGKAIAKATIICLMLVLAGLVEAAQATIIPITWQNVDPNKSEITVYFNQLAGTPLTGQSVSLDFFFFAHPLQLKPNTRPQRFAIVFQLPTNGTDFIAWGPASGYLLKGGAKPAQPPQPVILGGGHNAYVFGPSLYPLLDAPDGTPTNALDLPFMCYGAHFDLTFPKDPTLNVQPGAYFRVAGLVPDSGNTLALFVFGLAGLAVAHSCRCQSRSWL